MLNILKVKDYIEFGDKLKELTGCNVCYKIMRDDNHYHYELEKNGLTIGIVCYDKGKIRFAPFGTFSNCPNDRFIDFKFAPSFKDVTETLIKLSTLVLD